MPVKYVYVIEQCQYFITIEFEICEIWNWLGNWCIAQKIYIKRDSDTSLRDGIQKLIEQASPLKKYAEKIMDQGNTIDKTVGIYYEDAKFKIWVQEIRADDAYT